MKDKKKVVWFLLPAFLFVAFLCLIFIRHAFSSELAGYEKNTDNTYIYFGEYPQSQVIDIDLIKKLNQLPLQWKSYGYYNGDGSLGSATQSNYMQYADVKLKGENYRAVRFFEFRSYCCHKISDSSWQKFYYDRRNSIYWFHYDPIRWIVLNDTKRLLISEMLLDSQPINSIIYEKKPMFGLGSPEYYKDKDCTVYATDYYASDIRKWLNDDFFKTAFSPYEAEHIVDTELDNSAWSKHYSKYNVKTSIDKVFLLSYNEATDPIYGFSKQAEKVDALRIAFATDYAVCQGISVAADEYKNGASWWWLRTTAKDSSMNIGVNPYGSIQFSLTTFYLPDCIDTGIRPAIIIDPSVRILGK